MASNKTRSTRLDSSKNINPTILEITNTKQNTVIMFNALKIVNKSLKYKVGGIGKVLKILN
jgi:hypothetical protein